MYATAKENESKLDRRYSPMFPFFFFLGFYFALHNEPLLSVLCFGTAATGRRIFTEKPEPVIRVKKV